MTQMCGKWLKYVGNGLDKWSTAQVSISIANDLNILNMAQICGKAQGFTMLEMA